MNKKRRLPKGSSRALRRTSPVDPSFFERAGRSRSMWYESPDEIVAALEYGELKAERLRWARKIMGRRLTRIERRCITLYFMRGMTYRAMAKKLHTSHGYAHKVTHRALYKLRKAAVEDGFVLPIPQIPIRNPRSGRPR